MIHQDLLVLELQRVWAETKINRKNQRQLTRRGLSIHLPRSEFWTNNSNAG